MTLAGSVDGVRFYGGAVGTYRINRERTVREVADRAIDDALADVRRKLGGTR